ncbi:Ribosomal protein L36e [Paramicrosporidium saccamoebae]|uniref:60S ribosomal protein L36 n=1 Tax=Paramicrosporidium saccamoebae TaxID=1246581 RepID=A0A2H9TME0_9FUNG|nr:Ribosomal protein L36e [Paramicrosporidium saccamoebae]
MAAVKVAKSGIAVGANHGHIVTPRAVPAKPSHRKGGISKRVKFIRDLVREVTGFAPYERRILELLKNSKDKRARKLAKRRKKLEELNGVLAESRRAAH